jgi:histidine triad (HIT) family protein
MIRVMSDCVVCGGLAQPEPWRDVRIHDDELVMLAHVPPSDGASDGYPGHLLLVPRRHVERPGLLTDREAERIGLWLSRGSAMLESGLGAEHVYLARLGDGWAHLHYHLIPRYAGTPERYRGLDVREWQGVARCDRAGAGEIAGRLRITAAAYGRTEPPERA